MDEEVGDALSRFGVTGRVTVLKENAHGNSSWLVEVSGPERVVVLRRYHDTATRADIAYEHRVLRHAAAAGWTVPEPLTPLLEVQRRLYCLTHYVPGTARAVESPAERVQRGCDLARLHVALRPVTGELGQRPGWRPLHTRVTVHESLDWDRCLSALYGADRRLGEWADAAAVATTAALDAAGAHDLPVTLIHGDFAEWNVHYDGHGGLAGVVDFGLAHVDSRPYELAMARTYRAPEVIDAYRRELIEEGWPLMPVEDAAIPLLHHAFRVDMVAWELDHGRRTGNFDLPMIERQLARTGVAAP